jgi:hypothetical protein
MSNRNANDDTGAEGSLSRDAGWNDVWAGLLLTLCLLGSATLVVFLFSGQPSSLLREHQLAATDIKYLVGVRDPSRTGWRKADRPWNLMGIHENMADIEDRARVEPTQERRRDEGEATIETSGIDIRAWP